MPCLPPYIKPCLIITGSLTRLLWNIKLHFQPSVPCPIPPVPLCAILVFSPGPGSPPQSPFSGSVPSWAPAKPQATKSLPEATWGLSPSACLVNLCVSSPSQWTFPVPDLQGQAQAAVFHPLESWCLGFLTLSFCWAAQGFFPFPFLLPFSAPSVFPSPSASFIVSRPKLKRAHFALPEQDTGKCPLPISCPQNLSTPSLRRAVSSKQPFKPDYVFSCTNFLCLL